MELADASDLVTDAMSALGDKAGTVEQFADKLAKTSQKSNTSVNVLPTLNRAKSVKSKVDKLGKTTLIL